MLSLISSFFRLISELLFRVSVRSILLSEQIRTSSSPESSGSSSEAFEPVQAEEEEELTSWQVLEALAERQEALHRGFQILQRVAFRAGTSTLDYNQVAMEVDELHTRLEDLGVPPGDVYDEWVGRYLVTGHLPGTDDFDVN